MRTWRKSLGLSVLTLLLLAGPAAADPIITVTASSYYDRAGVGTAPPIALVNGAGFSGTAPNWTDADSDGVPEHNNEWRDNMWMSALGTIIADQWVMFDFGTVMELDRMRIWNFNQVSDYTAYPDKWKRGVNNAYIRYSVNGVDWTTHNASVSGGLRSFRPGTGLNDYDNVTNALFDGALARYVRIDIVNNWEGNADVGIVGLSEVDFTFIPEPAAMALLAAGGLGLLRRRRRRR